MDTLLKQWLDGQDFQEIIEENSLTEGDVLYILWAHGHLEVPSWLEQPEIEEYE